MKAFLKTVFGLIIALFLAVSGAAAFDRQPYSPEAFAAARKTGRAVVLVFHADWCPTCQKQDRSLEKLSSDPALKDLLVLKVDYDNSEDLQRELKVSRQSTLVVVKGTQEIGRKVGITKESELLEFLKTFVS